MSRDERAPRAFVLDEDNKPLRTSTRSGRAKSAADIVFAPAALEHEPVTVPQMSDGPRPRRMRFWPWLVGAVLALMIMWSGMVLTTLVENYFTRSPFLGWTVLALAGVALAAAIAITVREVWGFSRLRRIERLQLLAARALNLDEARAATSAIAELRDIYGGRHDMALGLRELERHQDDIIDPGDRMRLVERLLIAPLDEEAHKIIARRARRVTLLTTVTPAAALDIIFVASQNAAMLRELATLYGGRPSTLSTFKLGRMVIGHLAVTGGLALSDNLIQHVVGRGVLGRLSARFGEGAVNGILTCRIGLSAIDVCRPLPAPQSQRETLANLLRELVSFSPKDKAPGQGQ